MVDISQIGDLYIIFKDEFNIRNWYLLSGFKAYQTVWLFVFEFRVKFEVAKGDGKVPLIRLHGDFNEEPMNKLGKSKQVLLVGIIVSFKVSSHGYGSLKRCFWI